MNEKNYVLLGHQMFVGKETLFFRSTCKGIGGTAKLDEATRLTLIGAELNTIPPYDRTRGRGWEIIDVRSTNQEQFSWLMDQESRSDF